MADLLRDAASAKNGFTSIYACSTVFAEALMILSDDNMASVAREWRATNKNGDLANARAGTFEAFLGDLLSVSSANAHSALPVWLATYVY